MLDLMKNVETITKLNKESQNKLLRLFAKVDLTTKLKILQYQKQLFHKFKINYIDVNNEVLTLSSLILSINSFIDKIDNVNLNVIKIRGNNNKSNIKRQKLLSYWAIVKTLKIEQNMSFRDISIYFKKYHKFDVSYSTIFDIWNELENKEKDKK